MFLNFTVLRLISKAPGPWAGGWSICLVYSKNWIVHITVLVSRGEPCCPVFLTAYYFSSFSKHRYRPETLTGSGRPTDLVAQMHAYILWLQHSLFESGWETLLYVIFHLSLSLPSCLVTSLLPTSAHNTPIKNLTVVAVWNISWNNSIWNNKWNLAEWIQHLKPCRRLTQCTTDQLKHRFILGSTPKTSAHKNEHYYNIIFHCGAILPLIIVSYI